MFVISLKKKVLVRVDKLCRESNKYCHNFVIFYLSLKLIGLNNLFMNMEQMSKKNSKKPGETKTSIDEDRVLGAEQV